MKQFKKGDILWVRGHKSGEGKGLTYPSMVVVAKEDGNDSGWDVWDTVAQGTSRPEVVSIYGFSVSKVIRP